MLLYTLIRTKQYGLGGKTFTLANQERKRMQSIFSNLSEEIEKYLGFFCLYGAIASHQRKLFFAIPMACFFHSFFCITIYHSILCITLCHCILCIRFGHTVLYIIRCHSFLMYYNLLFLRMHNTLSFRLTYFIFP